jgi:hypothetical protein
MEIEAQKIIADFLLKGEPPYIKGNKESKESIEHFLQFAQAIGPFLSDDLKPYFLKESTEPLSQELIDSLNKASAQFYRNQKPPK